MIILIETFAWNTDKKEVSYGLTSHPSPHYARDFVEREQKKCKERGDPDSSLRFDIRTVDKGFVIKELGRNLS